MSCCFCGMARSKHLPVDVGTKQYREICPHSQTDQQKEEVAANELKAAKKELIAAEKAEWAARQNTKTASKRYAEAYEAVTGLPYEPHLFRETEWVRE